MKTTQPQSFWHQLKLPILGLSPMDGVTDQPYRYIQKKYGCPAVVYTEFTSVEGLCHGADRLLTDFLYDETQRPIVAQIYGTTPAYFRQAALLLCQLGFDGIDINMGCPAKNVAHSGAGAKLITTPELALTIVRETKAGVQDWFNGKTVDDCPNITPTIASAIKQRHEKLPLHYQQPNPARPIPVSVKTRVGYDDKIARDWTARLLEVEPAVIALHGRTLKQQYGGQADWDQIAQAAETVKSANASSSGNPILVFGNGDVQSYEQAHEYSRQYGVDGVLIGRASFGNPFVFLPESQRHYTFENQMQLALEHAQAFEDTYTTPEGCHFLPMRKHLGWYMKGFPFVSELRAQLFQTNSTDEARAVFETFMTRTRIEQ